MDIRAILLDADGVIQGPTPDFRARLCAAFDITLDQVDTFLHEIRSPAERRALTGERDFLHELTAEFTKENRSAPAPESLLVFTTIEIFADVIEVVGSLRSSGMQSRLPIRRQLTRQPSRSAASTVFPL
jgi:hypothetical protein